MVDEMKGKGRPRRGDERRVPPPLDEAKLRDLALHYAARFSTTRLKLLRYLGRKLKERGWAGAQPADVDALADRLAELGYVNDAAFAAMKSRAMAARGLGQRRVTEALAAAGVAADDRGEAPDEQAALATALAFARRKRLGPFAKAASDDPASRQKAFAAMLRAGHAMAVTRAILAARSIEEAEMLLGSD
ncbi:RecX family transcriptional regulator [Sandarakinorhabdus sp.]|uniref:RecX family transcriptional regulator n=1 Tax=Sandarakinorhabdus sp. TaxID=1916663 RepID=UPI00286E60E1|nr:RecX family transcriptional regulator [Sandarakinorhabdus sp.]